MICMGKTALHMATIGFALWISEESTVNIHK